jgi:thioredoxin reductase (NADPH)
MLRPTIASRRQQHQSVLPAYTTDSSPYNSPQSTKQSLSSWLSTSQNISVLKRRRRNGTSNSSSPCNIFDKQQLSLCWIGLAILACLLLLAAVVGVFAFGIERAWQADPRHQHQRTLLEAHRHKRHVNYDVVIAGAGPAGLAAALFAGRAGLKTLVTGSATGQLSETERLENFPSWKDRGGGGESWLEAAQRQASLVGVDFAEPGLLVSTMVRHEELGTFVLQLGTNAKSSPVVLSRAVIVATGATQRRLGLPHEEELWGKSIHSCAICDGSAYAGREGMTVVVVGGGDAAMDAAMLLARQEGTQVIVVHRQKRFRASNRHNVEQVLSSRQIQVRTQWEVERYERNVDTQQLQAIHVRHVKEEEKTERIPCNGVFLMIGSTPNTQWLSGTGVELDAEGLIVLRSDMGSTVGGFGLTMASTVPGIFAAGEVIDNKYRQAITGASAGAMAAIDVERWLRSQEPVPEFVQATTIPLQTKTISRNDVDADTDAANRLPTKPTLQKDTHRGVGTNSNKTHRKVAADAYDCDLFKEDCIQALVHKYPVVVWSKSWCPYCKKALEALSAEGVAQEPYLHVVQLDEWGHVAPRIQATLEAMTGRRTVPNVFVGGTSIGGGDDTVALHHEGKLRGLLLEAKAFPPSPSDNHITTNDIQKEEAAADIDNCDLTTQDCITATVHKFPVVVFQKPHCPYCKKAKEALRLEGVTAEPYVRFIDLTAMGSVQGGKVQDALKAMTGRRTVPNVFVGGKSIGGGEWQASLTTTTSQGLPPRIFRITRRNEGLESFRWLLCGLRLLAA